MSWNSNDEISLPGDLLGCALAVARTVDGEERSELIEAIAIQYAQVGDFDRAAELAESIQDPYLRDRAIATIAGTSVEAGLFDYSRDLLETIEDPSLVEVAVEEIAIKYAQRGDFGEAVRLTNELADPNQAISAIAGMQAANGFLEEAADLARSIEIPANRASTLAQLAIEALNKDRRSDAEELLSEASESAREIESVEDRAYSLIGIAEVYGQLGQREVVLEKLLETYELCDEIEASSSVGITATSGRDQVLSQIVGELAGANLLSKADEIIETIEDPFQFSLASIPLARAYDKLDHKKEAHELLSQGVEITREPIVTGERGIELQQGVLGRLAYAFAYCGDYDESLKIAGQVTAPYGQTSLLEEIGKLAIQADLDPARAAHLLSDEDRLASYWLQISDVYWKANRLEQAEATLRKAIDYAEVIERTYEKGLTLGEIATRLSIRDQAERANDYYTRALATVGSIEAGYQKVSALLDLARKQRSVGRDLTDGEQSLVHEIVLRLE